MGLHMVEWQLGQHLMLACRTQRALQMAMRGLEWGKIESTSCLQLKKFWTRSGPQISPNQTIHGALRVCILVTYILPCARDFVQFSFFPCTCLVMRWEASKSFGNQVQGCSNATARSKLCMEDSKVAPLFMVPSLTHVLPSTHLYDREN